jgi:hypothetical protein
MPKRKEPRAGADAPEGESHDLTGVAEALIDLKKLHKDLVDLLKESGASSEAIADFEAKFPASDLVERWPGDAPTIPGIH